MATIFDTSLLTENSSVSKEDFVKELLPKIQAILDKTFPNTPQKRRIRMYKDRISFAAPCCGDSAQNFSKKRGNIILEGRFKNMYKCHNCGTCMSIPNFLKRYGQSISLDAVDYISKNTPTINSHSNEDSSVNFIYNVNEIEKYAIDREFFKSYCGLVECNESSTSKSYLFGRKQYDLSRFLYSPKFNKLFVLNLTKSGKIFGLQVRNLNKNFDGPKYKTYNISKIYEFIFKQTVAIPDDIVSLSMIFNILLVDYTRPVTIVEGPMDSFLLKNCIALCGAGKHVSFPFECRYLFDDDLPGREHSIEKMNDGFSVFMWDKFRNDIGMPQQRKIDMNDVVIWAEKNKVKLPQIDLYFSSDELDLIGI